MTIFSDADLDDFASLAEDLALKDTCEVLRDVSSDDDGEGGEENIDQQVVATVKCMLTNASGRSMPTEQIVAGRLDGKTLQTIWFKRGAVSLLKSDLLRVNGNNKYHIMDVNEDSYEVLKPVNVWRTV
jgi:hypothetical protein